MPFLDKNMKYGQQQLNNILTNHLSCILFIVMYQKIA